MADRSVVSAALVGRETGRAGRVTAVSPECEQHDAACFVSVWYELGLRSQLLTDVEVTRR